MSESTRNDAPSHPSDRWLARFYREGDEDGTLELLLATFGSWPKHELTVPAIEHLRWKFLRDDMRPWHIVVEDNGTIIGLSAVFRQRLLLQGRVRDAYQLVDIAVLPAYQNQGVTTAARRLAVSDRIPHLGIYLNSGSQRDALPMFRRTRRWDPVTRRDTRLKVLVLDGPVAPPSTPPSPYVVAPVPRFDESIREFAKDATKPFDLIDAHEAELLNWRYCDPRAGSWTLVTAQQDGRMLGYITCRASHGRGMVGGLLALPERLDVVESLLVEAMRLMHQQDLTAIECWCPTGHPYNSVLTKVGITRQRRTVDLVISAAGEEFTYLERPDAALHIMAGDTDLV